MSFAMSPSYTNATVGRRPGSLLGSASACETITSSAVERSERSTAARAGIAQTRGARDLAAAADEIHYFQKPMRRQFRFATEQQVGFEPRAWLRIAGMQARALPLRRQCGRGDPSFRIGRNGAALIAAAMR